MAKVFLPSALRHLAGGEGLYVLLGRRGGEVAIGPRPHRAQRSYRRQWPSRPRGPSLFSAIVSNGRG